MSINALIALDLDELQEINFQVPEAVVKERFKIDGLDSLNWALRKLSALDAKQLDARELANKEKARIQEWLDKETRTIEESRQFFNMLIEEYARGQRARDPKWKASTPYGKVSFRKQPPKWEYDEKKALDTVESAGLGQFIRVKKELDKVALKGNVQVLEDGRIVEPESGAVIEGVLVFTQPEALKIEVADS
ncbi:host-nuclease inhibitor Gam family protein [Brevibacillus sp. SIMBA_040]|uniref:host-nuclease inhibitor Gam family protein n=1 Tax=unclassified Brevibacillus TaxID=2684853 RepID=UPI00397959FB